MEVVAEGRQLLQKRQKHKVQIVGLDEPERLVVALADSLDQRRKDLGVEAQQFLMGHTQFLSKVAQRDAILEGLHERGVFVVGQARHGTKPEPHEQATDPSNGIPEIGTNGSLGLLHGGVVPGPPRVDSPAHAQGRSHRRHEGEGVQGGR